MLSVFVGDFSRRPSPLFFEFFQSSVCLRLSCRRVFRNEALNGEPGVLSGRFFGPNNPCFSSRKRRQKVLLFCALFFRSSIFVTARFSGGFCTTNSVIGRGCGLVWYGVRALYGILYWIQGVLSPFSGSCVFVGPVSGSAVLLLSSLPLLPPFLGVGSGAHSCLPLLRACRTGPRRGRSVLHTVCSLSFLSVSSLCPGRLPPPSPSFLPSLLSLSLSLSLSLFLSLACTPLNSDIPPVLLAVP